MKRTAVFFFLILFVPPVLCQTLFTEVSKQAGLTYIYPGNDNQEVGGGVIVFDVNNDGWDDFFQAGGVFASKLWINKRGRFVDAGKAYGLDTLAKMYIQGGAAADYNNDGYEDLFLCNFGKGMRHGDDENPVLLLNQRGKRLVPVFLQTFTTPGNYTSCTWGDYNNDGYVDLYLTDYVYQMNNLRDSMLVPYGYDPVCMDNKFYKNSNGKGFVEAAQQYQLADKGCGLASMFTDYDRDGDVDLLLLNDFGSWNHLGNRLYRNNYPDDSFTDQSDTLGFYNEMYGMGIGAGDYDCDGDLDYYLTNIGSNYLYNNQPGRWQEGAAAAGVDNTYVENKVNGSAWSGLFADFDYDGWVDLYVSKGKLETLTPATVVADPNKLFMNLRNGRFADVSAQSGVNDLLSHRGAAVLDYDHDGDLDILSSVVKLHWAAFGGHDQKLKLYRNNIGKQQHWIALKLVGTGGINKSAIGASVLLQQGTYRQLKEVDGGSGHGSQSTRTVYFGLGKQTRAQQLSIRWPGNRVTRLKDLAADHVYTVNPAGTVTVLY